MLEYIKQKEKEIAKFMIYDKPIIYTDTKMDTSVYDAYWLKSPLWTLTILPKLGAQLKEENIGTLKELIETCIHDDRYAQGRDQARKETWEYEGTGAQRAADYLIAKQKELSSFEETK